MFMFDERCRADGRIDAPALHAPQRLTNSDEVDVFYDDGWWLMKFVGTRRSASGTEYHVRSDLYQVERWVPADHIRPHWRRRGAKWRELDQMRKQPAQAKAPPPKDASPSPKAAGPTAAPAASARTRKAPPVGKMASPSLRAMGAQDGARPTSAGGGSSAPLSVGIAPHIPGWARTIRMGGSIGELCGRMLRQMHAREEAAWFENPVSLGDVPDYLTVISQPMDYSTMGKKLAEGEYSADLLSFASDMRLIFSNALAYNWDPENECHQAAKQVHPAPLAPTAGVVSPVAHPPPRTRHVPCTSPTYCHSSAPRIWFAQSQRNFEMLFAAALEAKAQLRAAEASKDGTIEGGRTVGDAVSDKEEEDEEEDEAEAEEERGGDGDGVSGVSDDSEGEGEGEDGEGTATRLKREGLSVEDEMAFLIKLVVASGGSADMLDGWTIGRLTRGDKVYSDPDGVKMISRLQVVRHLHLDEAAGKRKLDAEKEQCKLAKQEEKRAVSSLRLNDL